MLHSFRNKKGAILNVLKSRKNSFTIKLKDLLFIYYQFKTNIKQTYFRIQYCDVVNDRQYVMSQCEYSILSALMES